MEIQVMQDKHIDHFNCMQIVVIMVIMLFGRIKLIMLTMLIQHISQTYPESLILV